MEKTIEIPEGVTVEKREDLLVIKGPKGTLERELRGQDVSIKTESGKIIVTSSTEKRKNLALAGTFVSHINNMILGVTQGFEARLKVIYSHFPMKLNVEGNKLVIQNFMGGRDKREVEILEGVDVKATKEEVIVSGIDKENVGQTAGRIEQKTTVRGFDRRVFQDGIHLIQKTAPAS